MEKKINSRRDFVKGPCGTAVISKIIQDMSMGGTNF